MRNALIGFLLLAGTANVAEAGGTKARPARAVQPAGAARKPAARPVARLASIRRAPAAATSERLTAFRTTQFEPLVSLFDDIEAGRVVYSRHNPSAGARREVDDSFRINVEGPLRAAREQVAVLNAEFERDSGALRESDPVAYRQRATEHHTRVAASDHAIFGPLGITWADARTIAERSRRSPFVSPHEPNLFVPRSHAEVEPEYLYDHRVPQVERIEGAALGSPAYGKALAAVRKDPKAMIRLLAEGHRLYGESWRWGSELSATTPEARAHERLFKDLRRLMNQMRAPAVRSPTISHEARLLEEMVVEAAAELAR